MSFNDELTSQISSARAAGIGDLLRRTAARYPAKIGIIDGDAEFSFAEFDRAVDRLVNGLAGEGVARGERVALLSRNSWQFAALSFATARLGAVLVPINFMLKPDEIAFIIDHSRATTFVAQGAFVDSADSAIAASNGSVRRRFGVGAGGGDEWRDLDALIRSAPDVIADLAPVADDDPIRLMYTSGTEARPKGALHSSRSLMAQYVGCIVDGGMTADDVDLHTLPLYHCAQLDCFLGPDVYLGATSVILPAPVPQVVLRTIQERRVTKFFAPPTVWISLLRSPEFDSFDLSSLSKGYYGASPMPVEVLKEIQERLPKLSLWNFYGQTELAPVATILPPHEQVSHAGSAGRAVLNVETRVVDDEGIPVRAGEVGEIVHRGPQVTLGYWNDMDKTAEAFVDGWFHSGDLGTFDAEGRLSIVDRKKDMIKTGGENVASREVEESLYTHPAIAEVAVFATADPRWVEAVNAAIVLKAGQDVTAEEIRAYASERLARYKVPKRVHILAELPKNPSGKILKRELRATFESAN